MAFDLISNIRGLKPIKATAAIYMMIGIDMTQFKDFADDYDFCWKLYNEQNVMTMPSICFFSAGFFRIVNSINFVYITLHRLFV